MKALYTTGPGDYGLVERPRPAPAPDEALVKVARATLCHTDVIIRDGRAGHVRYPLVPGHEFAGVVEECGREVEYVNVGDRVAVSVNVPCGQCASCRHGDALGCEHFRELGASQDGGFAEYCAVPARLLFRMPDHLTMAEGALVEPLANAVSAVRKVDVSFGERVVIIGPGPVGLLALQVARLSRPPILVLVGTRDERLARGKSFGATHTVNIRREGAQQELAQILDGGGADVAMECAGTRSALELALGLVGWRGRVALEGVHDTDAMVPVSPHAIMANSLSLIGICGWETVDFARALELISCGLVDVRSLVTHTFPLDEWEVAFDMITQHKSESLKVQFVF